MRKNNYYKELDEALKSYEEYKRWHEKSFDWICDRIDWCWKWRKITEEQMEELTGRVVKYLKKEI